MSVKIIYLISLIFFCLSGILTYKAVIHPNQVQRITVNQDKKISLSAVEEESYIKQFRMGGHVVFEKIKGIKDFLWRIIGQEKFNTKVGFDEWKNQGVLIRNPENSFEHLIENRSPALEHQGLEKSQNGAQKLNMDDNDPELRTGLGVVKTNSHDSEDITQKPAAIQEGYNQLKKDVSGDPSIISGVETMAGESGDNTVNESLQMQKLKRERNKAVMIQEESEVTKSGTAKPDLSLQKKMLVVFTFEKGLTYYGKYQAHPEIEEKIKEAAHLIESDPNAVISVEGHADNVPLLPSSDRPYNDNMGLSLWRATVIAERLMQEGIPADRLEVTAYGETHPIASNETAEGRTKNRRVEVVLKER